MIGEIVKIIGIVFLIFLVSIILSGILSGIEIEFNEFRWEFAGIIELLKRWK